MLIACFRLKRVDSFFLKTTAFDYLGMETLISLGVVGMFLAEASLYKHETPDFRRHVWIFDDK